MQSIKDRARGLHLTQQMVADELKVSLPTVKRWWTGQGVSLGVLGELCSLMDLSLAQLFLELETSTTSTYRYSLEQEQMLATYPKVLALFDLLVSGKSPKWAQTHYALSENELLSMLLKLDRAGLIELYDKMKLKLRRQGEPQWIEGGPLSLKYRKRMIQSLLGEHAKAEVSFYIHDYLPADVALLKGKQRELENLMLTCNLRGCTRPAEASSYGVYLCVKPFEWDLRDSLKKK